MTRLLEGWLRGLSTTSQRGDNTLKKRNTLARRDHTVRHDLSWEEHGAALREHWRRTLRFTLILLAVWFVVGYVVAIILAPLLNRVDFLGGPLGFWIAQNGAIYVFWLLILIYAVGMNRLDREFDLHELDA